MARIAYGSMDRKESQYFQVKTVDWCENPNICLALLPTLKEACYPLCHLMKISSKGQYPWLHKDTMITVHQSLYRWAYTFRFPGRWFIKAHPTCVQWSTDAFVKLGACRPTFYLQFPPHYHLWFMQYLLKYLPNTSGQVYAVTTHLHYRATQCLKDMDKERINVMGGSDPLISIYCHPTYRDTLGHLLLRWSLLVPEFNHRVYAKPAGSTYYRGSHRVFEHSEEKLTKHMEKRLESFSIQELPFPLPWAEGFL